ncbi:bifunctional tetrahydrofolate synthase/dihydrofolate synthase [Lampropedia aestuarii]|uniref:bifunctional tetrahydrofolate synthase/dihydrofolate synthase n=1 Tax=Lampropedia aestuarii TaxID=2562762 RepID=UPI002469B30B|nr:bifunctional tetrahydrofolate synthase/dihydrofolate synthase [Lampropedia aestuarii]MDH5858339.1 bifunctional tetrahydrofolate synthase/dihydrofolate synthase [Lampropedia aestuarii]
MSELSFAAPAPGSALTQWLSYCERIHPTTIELGLERVAKVAQTLQLHFDCPVITVAGTNGKGSTCAMLEAIALQSGYRAGVYTSPHLVDFEERCRVGGEIVQADALVPHFEAVEQARFAAGGDSGPVSLSYFEFTTLAIARLLSHSKLDVAILEVGLGGRLDATNIVDADCAIITSIDIDHIEFLGPDRESIGREKAGIMRAGKPVVVSDPMPPQSVIAHAEAIGADLWLAGRDFNYSGDRQQWNWAGRGKRFHGLAYPALRGANQLINAAGVLAAFQALRQILPVTVQAVREGFAIVDVPGRFQIVPGQPNLVLDVAHNPHSVAALAVNLDAMGFFPVTHAVFGAMHDKDLVAVMQRMGPLVDRWYFTDLPLPRAEKAADLVKRWQALQMVAQRPREVPASAHATPQLALEAAVRAADPADRIVVFGSFYTVGGVLSNGIPRLDAPHWKRDGNTSPSSESDR